MREVPGITTRSAPTENGRAVFRNRRDGTLTCHGKATDDVKQRLTLLAAALDIHILTGDKKAKRTTVLAVFPSERRHYRKHSSL